MGGGQNRCYNRAAIKTDGSKKTEGRGQNRSKGRKGVRGAKQEQRQSRTMRITGQVRRKNLAKRDLMEGKTYDRDQEASSGHIQSSCKTVCKASGSESGGTALARWMIKLGKLGAEREEKQSSWHGRKIAG